MREVIDRAGDLMLACTDGVYEILWDGMFLMSSMSRAGERALGAVARGRTLVGGLGMGYTLRAALDAGAASVDVAEIAEAVVRWNRGELAPLAGRPLDDARVRVHLGDVAALVRAAPDASWDTVLLDVDNGPSWTARPENDALYGDAALAQLARVLTPGGMLAVWSAQAEPDFTARLRHFLDDVREQAVPAYPTDDWLVLGTRKMLPIV